jgi:hypothetical protein
VKVVIQCAGSKHADAGCLRTTAGQQVLFVADPRLAPVTHDFVYARPDDLAESSGETWRQRLQRYNAGRDNPLRLHRAFELYDNPVYRRLVQHYGVDNVFILSAGWGLIRADFLTPAYDITFSAAVRHVAPYKLRRKTDAYHDFQQLPESSNEPVVFFGGKDYRPLFCALTAHVKGPRLVFFNSARVPAAVGCLFRRFETTTRTNWHYECASAFIEGAIKI